MTERLLFVRCVPQPLAIAALDALRRARPGARIDVLSNEAAAPALVAAGAADGVVPYPGAAYGVLHAGLRLVLSLRRQRYDAVIVPFTGRGRDAFWNVARLALLLGASETLWQRVEPAATPAWTRVSLHDWWAGQSIATRIRHGLSKTLAVPALLAAFVVAMAGLALLAAILLPFVWLKPAHAGRLEQR